MHATITRSVLFRSFIYIVSFYLVGLGDSLIPDVSAAGDFPSQKARFQGMGSTFKAKKKEAAAKSSKKTETTTSEDESATYFKLHTFVVNVVDQRYKDKLIFLTLEVFCKINQPDDKWLIDNNIAPIKDTIITYISGLSRDKIQTQKQKKQLQKDLTLRVANVLKELIGKEVISDLYLTRIIIQ